MRKFLGFSAFTILVIISSTSSWLQATESLGLGKSIALEPWSGYPCQPWLSTGHPSNMEVFRGTLPSEACAQHLWSRESSIVRVSDEDKIILIDGTITVSF